MLGESVCLGLIGAVLGMVLAVIGLRTLLLAPTARGFIDPNLPPPGAAPGLDPGPAAQPSGRNLPGRPRRVARPE